MIYEKPSSWKQTFANIAATLGVILLEAFASQKFERMRASKAGRTLRTNESLDLRSTAGTQLSHKRWYGSSSSYLSPLTKVFRKK